MTQCNQLAVAYYPEHVDESFWPRDLSRMRDAGITAVRVLEFAWSRMEPREGDFTFAWIHRFMQLTQAHGIQVILCTPTASQPPWLMQQYPDTVYHDLQGNAQLPGRRRAYCFSSPRFRELGARITLKMVEELKQYPNILGWQIDNELGFNFCKCPQCRSRYQQFLRERYGDLTSLNAAWGLAFWSAEFSAWEEINFEMLSPESKLAESRFFSALVIDFLHEFAELLRANHPGVLITTNFMGNFEQVNYFDAAKVLDVIGWDFYYELYTLESTSMACDLMRCLKQQPFWTLENSTGCLGNWKHMDPRLMVLLAVKAWAHGEVLHTKFPWRAFLAGVEQVIYGLVDQADRTTRSYQATQQLSAIYQTLPTLTIEDFQSEVAYVYSYENFWGFQALPGMPNYYFVAEGYYKSLNRLGVCIDVVSEDADFSHYKALVFPPYLFIDDALAKKVRQFVDDGGAVIVAPPSFSRDRELKWQTSPPPAGLNDLFGAVVKEGYSAANYLGNATSCLGCDVMSVNLEPPSYDEYRVQTTVPMCGAVNAINYFSALEPHGAEVWASYTDGDFAGEAAITAHHYGNGLAVLIGCGLPEAAVRAIYHHVLQQAGVSMTLPVNADVEVVPLQHHYVYLNHTPQTCREPLPQGHLLLGNAENDELVLPAYGFAVVER